MSSHSCASSWPGRTRTSLAGVLAGLLVIIAPARLACADNEDRDPELREKLRVAISTAGSFDDEFDAEVWLTDMSRRLARKVPDPEERVQILVAAHREATTAGLPPEMILAVIDVESNFQRYAVSRANAQGLMQVMRFWLDELNMPGHSLFDIERNIRMGCTILKHYYDIENGDWTRALGRYNGSLGSKKYPNLVFDRLYNRWYQQ